VFADSSNLREKVLAKYLDGEIDEAKLENMFSLIDHGLSEPKVNSVAGYQ
jgi:hypothetical protein